jgi:hypothetical protein
LPRNRQRGLAPGVCTTQVAEVVEARLREEGALEREELLEPVRREAERDRRLVDALSSARGRDRG